MRKNRGNLSKNILILGLGNPGNLYEGTRHNVGKHVVDLLLKSLSLSFHQRFFSSYSSVLWDKGGQSSLLFLRYLGYMNHSGKFLPFIKKRYHFEPSQFLVILDNMDLPVGRCRLKRGGTDAGHRGLKSLIETLGYQDFFRLYIGVGRPPPHTSVIDHVLSLPSPQESLLLDALCLRLSQTLKKLAEHNFETVAEMINQREN